MGRDGRGMGEEERERREGKGGRGKEGREEGPKLKVWPQRWPTVTCFIIGANLVTVYVT